MISFGLLFLRLTVGGLLAGHGAQKLFGWFGGHGMEGTSGWLASMGFRPARTWAALAGLSEFGGGVLTLLGLLNPIGPLVAMGSMLMATVKVHRGRPIWATEGGAELPVTNMAAQAALIIAGPGRLSLDRLLGVRLPRWIAIPGLAVVGGLVAYGMRASEAEQAAARREEQAAERPAAGEAAQPGEPAEPPGEQAAAEENELRQVRVAATEPGERP